MSTGAGSESAVENNIVFILRIKDRSISVLTTQHTSCCTCKSHITCTTTVYLFSNGIVLLRSYPIVNNNHVMYNHALNHAMYGGV
jgi:hypothetical protein